MIVLKHMAGKYQGALTTAKEVSELYKTPFDVTAKVMQALAQRGLLRSEQGPHGGYLLVRDLGRVSFFDLVEIVEGPVGIAKCLLENSDACDLSPTCNIASPVSQINQKLIEFYKNLSMLEAIGPVGRKQSLEVQP